MTERNKEAESSHEQMVEKVLKYLGTLNQAELVDASHDMDCAIQGEGYTELPLWLRGVSREVIMQARHKMLSTLNIQCESGDDSIN